MYMQRILLNGVQIPNANDYFTSNEWAEDGWRIEYQPYQINVFRLDDMHKNETAENINYNDCIMKGIKIRKRLPKVKRAKQEKE